MHILCMAGIASVGIITRLHHLWCMCIVLRGAKPAKKGRNKMSAWGSDKGWKAVSIGDEFLLGAEDGGFAGLEVLDDPTIIEQYVKVSIEALSDYTKVPGLSTWIKSHIYDCFLVQSNANMHTCL